MEIALLFLAIAVLFVMKTVKVVPQQNAWVVERLGKYHASLTPGLNFVVPFIDNDSKAQPQRNSARCAQSDLHHT
jgi:regulator of protease activity HflC (stomatin/prohibitin superfamily)